jgi:hypothetical protein
MGHLTPPKDGQTEAAVPILTRELTWDPDAPCFRPIATGSSAN